MTVIHTPIPFSIPLPPSPPYDDKEPQPEPISYVLGPLTPARTPHTSGSELERHVRATTSGSEGKGALMEDPRGVRDAGRPAKRRGKVQLEDFELIRVLGKGCAGRVLLVRDARWNTVHAMKAISKRSVLSAKELPHTLTELSILKQFAIHEPDNDFITRLNCSFTDRENFYFVMDFYPGGDLATQLEIYGKLGSARTRFYAADLVLGLEDLHRNGIILRDLKPENILLDSRGHCVIADFGLSKQFAYRGPPEPIHVPRFDGDKRFPTWAGKGMGSLRTSISGMERIVIDRANSFVGTTDYLAPEVVLGQEYTYAVDWWAFGCIVFECLFGRAPFRSHNSDNCQVLYNKILYNHWGDSINPRDDKLDVVTDHFLDALLQKDPVRRLTEPGVRSHHYFVNVDWDTVRSREYEDPHQLNLHPIAEYNTRYFPRLCLEQEPSVDMSTHAVEDEGADHEFQEGSPDKRQLTALNDENTYIFQQHRYRKELEEFYWDKNEHLAELEAAHTYEAFENMEGEAKMDEVEGIAGQSDLSEERHQVTRSDIRSHRRSSENASLRSSSDDIPDKGKAEGDGASKASTEIDHDFAQSSPTPDTMDAEERIWTQQVESRTKNDSAIEPPRLATPTLPPVTLSGAVSTMQLGSPAASMDLIITPDASSKAIPVVVREAEDDDIPSSNPVDVPVSPLLYKSMEDSISATNPVPPLGLLSPPASRQTAPAGRPIPANLQTLQRPETQPRLPSGLPGSGLSVSDIVSIPSPGVDVPRLIRRHAPMPSIESIPVPRLSIDVHGTITQLGEDDWEAVDIDGDIPSMPNGYAAGLAPSSFFTRLRRRPSTIVASGLRRQTAARGSDSSRDSSPTKGPTLSRPIFSTPKKALEKLIALPKIRSRHPSEESSSTSTDGPASPIAAGSKTQPSSPILEIRDRLSSQRIRPSPPARRNTASEWVERRFSTNKSKPKRLFDRTSTPSRSSERSLTQCSETAASPQPDTWGSALEGKLAIPPRLELKESDPVVWDFEPKREKGASE